MFCILTLTESAANTPKDEAFWLSQGFTQFIAEALEGREITPAAVEAMTEEDLLDEVLQWHGIVGFTGSIYCAMLAIKEAYA